MCVLQAFVQNDDTIRLSHGVEVNYKKVVRNYDTIILLKDR